MLFHRAIAVLTSALAAAWLAGGQAIPARGDVAVNLPCRPAELFATNNTATITDPAASQLQDGLALFEIQADVTITQNGAAVSGSTLLDGVFWSNDLQQSTYERSREFHVCVADESTLHIVAEALRGQFNQESVLSFDYLAQHSPDANAITITVPNMDVARFRDALVADPDARNRLQGGSVTTTDHTLILIAANADRDIARRLIGEAGGSWSDATFAYGKDDFAD